MKPKALSAAILFSVFISSASAFGARENPAPLPPETDRLTERVGMVTNQIASRGIDDPSVLSAMESVPRHRFIPETGQDLAYADRPVLIGEGQTISQPYIVALMTQLMDLDGSERVLEIGTGSGYQAAVLSKTSAEVYSIEIKPALYERSTDVLNVLGYGNVTTMSADGYFGWTENAPFDAIMITAAANHIPPPLLDQLTNGGILVMPLGDPFGFQQLIRITKVDDDYLLEQITGVMFVPMTGTVMSSQDQSP